jgi:NTE family protein
MAISDINAAKRASEPVARIPSDAQPTAEKLEHGTALCLSGGGYRAMLFHTGALWRLYEAGMVKPLARISSVSGGSITAGVLASRWSKLSFQPEAVRDDFVPQVVAPIRKLAGETLDASAVIGGALWFGTISDRIAEAYRDNLFGKATLQDLPDAPRFVINATNVQTGALWRFSKPYMGDWRVGLVDRPRVELAVAVAASSAFPPVLSPCTLKLDPKAFRPGSGEDLQREPFTSRVVLSDGGVYDNLGLETAYKNFDTILVSDGGGKLSPEEEPKEDWARHAYRVLNVIDDQVRSLRKRQLIAAYQNKERQGTYWGIRTNIADYGLPQTLPCPFEWSLGLADEPTRLKRMPSERQEAMINWGYAVCDAALRRHANPGMAMGRFPYA